MDDKDKILEQLMKFIREDKRDQFMTEVRSFSERKFLSDYPLDDGCTLLMVAACLGVEEIVFFLINECECDVNLKNYYEWTALMFATHGEGNTEIIKLLLEKGAEVNATDNRGSTALHLAAHKSRPDIVKLLLEHQADKRIKDDAGWTALQIAKHNNCSEIVQLLENKSPDFVIDEKIVQSIRKGNVKHFLDLLNENNRDNEEFLNSPFDDKCTWLMCAAFHGRKEIVEYLLDKNCDVNLKSSADWTALMFAAHRGHVDIVKILLGKRADIDATNIVGSTALHLATDKGHADVVKQLLVHGSKTDIEDKEGWTAYLIAQHREYHEIISLIENYTQDSCDSVGSTSKEKNIIEISKNVEDEKIINLATETSIEVGIEIRPKEKREVYVEDDDMDVVKIDQPLEFEEGIISTSISSEMQQLSITYQSSSSDSDNCSVEVYKDNPYNQKRNRAGKPKYSVPISGKPLLYKDTTLNRSLGRVEKPWGTCPKKEWLYTKMLEKLMLMQEGEDFPEDITESYENDKVAKYLIKRCMDLKMREKTIREWLEQKGKGWKAQSHLSLQTIEKYKGNVILFKELELIAKIGHGKLGEVHFAKWKDGEVVAVKTMKAKPVFQRKRQQFKEKIKVACTLQHSNIVTFLGVCDTGYHIVMEYMDMSLYDALHIKQVDFAEQDKLKIMSDIAKGIKYLHASNIAHCNLKISNVLLNNVPGQEVTDSQEQVIAKITDFRLSVIKNDMGSSASAVVNIKTPIYQAPEVLRDKTLEVDKLMKDDVYSEGMVIWELVFEEIPENMGKWVRYIWIKQKYGIPRGLKLNRQLEELLEKCSSTDPEDRPSAHSVCLMVDNIHKLFDDSEGE